MYFPTHFTSSVIDPLERERISSGRPESRWEITQRHHQQSRKYAPFLTRDDEPATSNRAAHVMPSIRRALSRVLITTGERINPEAA